MSERNCTGAGGRGCSCEWHAHRRVYNRRFAAERRAKNLAEKNAGASTCQARLGQYGVCGGILETVTDGNGGTVTVCRLCERKRRGICRECGLPVEGQRGKALRCDYHKKLEKDRAWRRRRDRDPEAHRRAARLNYQRNEERRKRRNEYKRLWRKTNREKVREYKKRYVERHAKDPNSAYNRYHQKYRARYRLQKRELERERLASAPQARKTSPKCTRCGKSTRWKPVPHGGSGRPWTVCTACLHPCEQRERRKNRRKQIKRAREWEESIPKRVAKPPRAAVRGPGWERLCITPGCETVVTHRKKKCTKCQARDRELAAQLLASSRGRGRRTDLERVA